MIRPSYHILDGRRRKRLANRLRKKGLRFERFAQYDPQLITMQVVLQEVGVGGRAFVYPTAWLKKTTPRVIADAVLSDYQRGYGHPPRRLAS